MKGFEMKITSVAAVPLGVHLEEALRWGAMSVSVKGGIVVRVGTDEGIEGIGEAGFSAVYYPTVGPIVNDQLGPMIIGRDPLDIGALWHDMMASTHMWGRRGVETYALSGIDIALWDLMGKVTGQPLHRLLGTDKRAVRAYYAPSLKNASESVDDAKRAVQGGFTAIKLRVDGDLAAAVDLVGAVRDAVGAGVDLMVDANMAYDRRGALSLAKELEDLDVAWLEEPILSRSLSQYVEDHAWLADHVSLPLAGGESLLTRFEYIDLMSRHVFDIIQPDCTSVGGISEAKRVADMASAWNIRCVPHIGCSSGTGIGLAAGLQLILSCSNAPFIEFDAYGGPGWDGLLVDPIRATNGIVVGQEKPGLGVEISSDGYERFAL